MRNPWTAKNPFMSAWLSQANRIAGSARGQAVAAAKREVASMQTQASKQLIDFWSGTTANKAPPVAKKKAKKR